MVYWRYMVDRRLAGHESKEYKWKKPLCQVCGMPVTRMALRDDTYPYRWRPRGWMCQDCNIVDVAHL